MPIQPALVVALAGALAACESGAGDDPARAPGGANGGRCELTELPALTADDVVPRGSLDHPVYMTQAPEDEERLFVLEQGGRILIVRDGSVLEEPFLDLRDRVQFENPRHERGLLGMAFHPDYAENGRFFVYYTPEGRNVLAEYRVSADPERADPAEVRRLFDLEDPELNHNGGMIAFGPEGFLYVAIGDGGGFCDPWGELGNAQDLSSPFGKIHRLDTDADDEGFAAPGNPFAEGGGLATIWAYGLRNPWRFSFDRETGDLYIGDVGDRAFEEINFQPAGAPGGANYGWRDFEGLEASTVSGCEPSGTVSEEEHTEPIVVHPLHDEDDLLRSACAIIAGYVYRGEDIPALWGRFLYGDFCSADIAAFQHCEGEVRDHERVPGLEGVGSGLSSFAEDRRGELYLLHLHSGTLKRIVAAE